MEDSIGLDGALELHVYGRQPEQCGSLLGEPCEAHYLYYHVVTSDHQSFDLFRNAALIIVWYVRAPSPQRSAQRCLFFI